MPQDLLGLLSTTSPGARVARVAAVSASVAKSSGRTWWGWGPTRLPGKGTCFAVSLFRLSDVFSNQKNVSDMVLWYSRYSTVLIYMEQLCKKSVHTNHGVSIMGSLKSVPRHCTIFQASPLAVVNSWSYETLFKDRIPNGSPRFIWRAILGISDHETPDLAKMISLVSCWQLLAASEIFWWTNRQKVARVATFTLATFTFFHWNAISTQTFGLHSFFARHCQTPNIISCMYTYINHIYSIYILTLEGFGCYATNHALRENSICSICSTWFRAYFKHLGAGKALTPQMFRQKSWPIEGQGPLYPPGSKLTCPNYSGSTQTFNGDSCKVPAYSSSSPVHHALRHHSESPSLDDHPMGKQHVTSLSARNPLQHPNLLREGFFNHRWIFVAWGWSLLVIYTYIYIYHV